MNLACPKCGTEDTKKLSLIMNEGGAVEKVAQLGTANFYNIAIPLLTVMFACWFGFMFALQNTLIGFLVFVGGSVCGLQASQSSEDEDEAEVCGYFAAAETG